MRIIFLKKTDAKKQKESFYLILSAFLLVDIYHISSCRGMSFCTVSEPSSAVSKILKDFLRTLRLASLMSEYISDWYIGLTSNHSTSRTHSAYVPGPLA